MKPQQGSRTRSPRPTPSVLRDKPMFLLSQARLLHGAVLEGLLRDEGIANRVKPGMGPALFALFHGDGMLLKDLAAQTGMAASTVTEVVQRMERAGLVERAPDAEDGRAVRLHLTTRGHAVKPRVVRVARRFEAILQHGMEPADVACLAGVLRRVVENFHEHLGSRFGKGRHEAMH